MALGAKSWRISILRTILLRRNVQVGVVQSGAASAAVIELAAFEALRGASEEANVTLNNLSTLD